MLGQNLGQLRDHLAPLGKCIDNTWASLRNYLTLEESRAPVGTTWIQAWDNFGTLGDMASDLYGPQFWDDNFQFSFSVVVSCKSNKQLGYF